MKHRLNLEKLAVQSFDTRPLSDDEAFNGNSAMQCVSELSHCGVCPTEPGTAIA